MIPTISLKPFLNPTSSSDKKKIATNLYDVCSKFGAFYLTDHQIPTTLQAQVFANSKSFFTNNNNHNSHIKQGGFTRGFIPIGGESGSSDHLEVKEAFSYGYNFPASQTKFQNPLQGHNVWPQNQEDFVKTMNAYYLEKVRVSEALTRAFSMSLGFPEDLLGGFCKGGDTISIMRVFRYLQKERGDGVKSGDFFDRIGSSSHTDWGFLTLILQQEGVLGLQIQHDNKWIDAPPIRDTLFCNAGDYLSILTNFNYISPVHRVVHPNRVGEFSKTDLERLSFVFFYYPAYDAKIPNLAKNDRLSLFKDQFEKSRNCKKESLDDILANKSFGEFILQKWSSVYRETK